MATMTASASLIPTVDDFRSRGSTRAGHLVQAPSDRVQEVLVRSEVDRLQAWFRRQDLPAVVLVEALRLLDVLFVEYSSISRHGEAFLLPIPVGSAREDGHAMLSWDCGTLHFEVELTAEGMSEWFFWNRDGLEAAWEEDLPFGGPLPSSVMARLDRLRK
jgi:hypothetical protein